MEIWIDKPLTIIMRRTLVPSNRHSCPARVQSWHDPSPFWARSLPCHPPGSARCASKFLLSFGIAARKPPKRAVSPCQQVCRRHASKDPTEWKAPQEKPSDSHPSHYHSGLTADHLIHSILFHSFTPPMQDYYKCSYRTHNPVVFDRGVLGYLRT